MDTTTKPKLWKHISDIHKDGIAYMENRRDGTIKSISTPWKKFDDAGIGGLEWGTITVIGGRPGSGKTLIVNQITRQAHTLNPTQDFCVLDFQFEMSNKTTAVREFSSIVRKTYRELVSVDKKVDEHDLNVIKSYVAKHDHKEIYQVDASMTLHQMKQTILQFLHEKGKPTIITIDHSVLIKKDASEKDKFEMLYNLGEMLTELKKAYPVIFIVLTQMNRSIEAQERKVPGTVGNYPTTADVFGADALLQHCDLMVAINKPSEYYLDLYGPEQYIVDEKTLALHFVKARNGDRSMCFFEAQFEHMSIKEVPVPPTKTSRLRTRT